MSTAPPNIRTLRALLFSRGLCPLLARVHMLFFHLSIRRENALLTEDMFGNPVFRINILQSTKNYMRGDR